jgi:hypothetical protein
MARRPGNGTTTTPIARGVRGEPSLQTGCNGWLALPALVQLLFRWSSFRDARADESGAPGRWAGG